MVRTPYGCYRPLDLWANRLQFWGMKLTVCVPCYNEAQRLPQQKFLQFALQNPEITLLFVDDGSKDKTLEVLSSLKSQAPNIVVHQLAVNSGKAEAVRQGLLQCFATSQWIAYWDADLATPLEEIPRFIRVIEQNPNVQIVMGLRLKRLGAHVVRKTSRHYIGRVFATMASLALGIQVYDTQCGAKFLKTTPAIRYALAQPFLARWVFDVELLKRFLHQLTINSLRPLQQVADEAIFELPLNTWEDVKGSKVKLKDMLRAAFDLLRIKLASLS